MSSRLGLSWTQTIRFLFQTPLVPPESKQEKVVEIDMVDLSPTQSIVSSVSSRRNGLDLRPEDRRAPSSPGQWSDISLA